jgi:hypothetical protein
MRFKFKLLFIGLLLSACFLPAIGRADTEIDLSVTPAVIDIASCEKGQICLEKPISIKNNSSVRADVYAQVNDLSPNSGLIPYSDPSDLPANASLVRWIDFYRSVIEIAPGETATQTLRITASPNAQPGTYHAIISFPTGGNLTEAQVIDQKLNEEKVQINLNIVAHQVEQAEISRYQPLSPIFTKNNIGFDLKIKNIGNQPVTPTGGIVIYNKGGAEVGSMAVGGSIIAPGEIKDLSFASSLNIGPGKFKAVLNLNYGQDNGKNLTDIVYFSYLPLIWSIMLIVIFLGLAIFAALVLAKKRRQQKNTKTVESAGKKEFQPVRQHPHHVINLKKRD